MKCKRVISMKKRVLHILSSNQFSGAENVCVNLIKNTADNFESAYCSPYGPIEKRLHNIGIRYIGVGKISVQNIKNVIREWHPDIIHAHDVRASVIASMATLKIPVISQLHGNFPEMHIISLKSLLYYIASKRFSYILYVSKSIYSDFKFKSILDKKGVLYENKINPLDIAKRCDLIKITTNYDLIFIGRFEEVKNPMRFIGIVEKLQKKFPKLRTCMLGDGSLFTKCKKYAEGKRINIDFLGFQEEPLQYLIGSKCLLITSKYEGIPMVALEALSCLKPVISTPTDGLLELIVPGKNGYICETDEEFVNRISDIFLNDELYKSMINYIKNSSSDDYDQYRNTLLNLYKKTCED